MRFIFSMKSHLPSYLPFRDFHYSPLEKTGNFRYHLLSFQGNAQFFPQTKKSVLRYY